MKKFLASQKIILLSLACLVYSSTASCVAPENKFPSCKSIIIALPKSGGHLLTKCLNLILNRKRDPKMDRISLSFPDSLYQQPVRDLYLILEKTKKNIWHTHLHYRPEYVPVFIETESPFLFGYRDPRDLVVSMARFMKHDKISGVDALSMNDLMLKLIQDNYLTSHQKQDDFSTSGHPPVRDIFDLYNNIYLPWRNVPGCYSVRFENLIGAQGGGSDEKQLEEIKNIAKHIGVSITHEKAKKIAENLFGGTLTFNATVNMAGTEQAGQIGSWKSCFTEEHKRLFKEVAGQLLIDLGYEADMNW